MLVIGIGHDPYRSFAPSCGAPLCYVGRDAVYEGTSSLLTGLRQQGGIKEIAQRLVFASGFHGPREEPMKSIPFVNNKRGPMRRDTDVLPAMACHHLWKKCYVHTPQRNSTKTAHNRQQTLGCTPSVLKYKMF